MIGFLGGTGPEGRGLGLRLALAGHDVMIGSRDAVRAQEAAERVAARGQGMSVEAGLNEDVAVCAGTVFVTVPYEGQRPLLESLAEALSGKIVVTTVVPLRFDAGGATFLPIEARSAAMEAHGDSAGFTGRGSVSDDQRARFVESEEAHRLRRGGVLGRRGGEGGGCRAGRGDSWRQGSGWRRSAECRVRRAHYAADSEPQSDSWGEGGDSIDGVGVKGDREYG